MRIRRLLATVLTAGSLVGFMAVAAHADNMGCNGSLNVCGVQGDPASVGGGNSSSWAATYSTNGASYTLKTDENHETHHFYGWSTDNTATNGPANTTYIEADLQVKCNGDLQQYYEHSWRGSNNFTSQQAGTFTC